MLRTVVVALCMTLAVPALAGPDPKPAPTQKAGAGTTAVKQANDTISALLKQKVTAGSKEEKDLATKVTTSVRGFLDVDELGRRAMVDQWAKLSKEQQTEFLTVLRELIEGQYVRGLRANLSYTVEYVSETTDKAGNVVVTTKVNTQRRGRAYSIEVVYVLVKDGGKLRAIDVKTDGVGLIENYRITFNKLIEKGGFANLIQKMKKKQAETAKS